MILEGTVESTGAIIQARTSYLNTEILWGHRFNQLLFIDTDPNTMNDKFQADLSLFNSTYEVYNSSGSAASSRIPVKKLKQLSNKMMMMDSSILGMKMKHIKHHPGNIGELEEVDEEFKEVQKIAIRKAKIITVGFVF